MGEKNTPKDERCLLSKARMKLKVLSIALPAAIFGPLLFFSLN
jgi:hypothetical protein